MSDEDAFYAAYLDNVKTDLIMNSKPVIHTLTQIAGENKQFACAVVDALRTHIKEVCSAGSGGDLFTIMRQTFFSC